MESLKENHKIIYQFLLKQNFVIFYVHLNLYLGYFECKTLMQLHESLVYMYLALIDNCDFPLFYK